MPMIPVDIDGTITEMDDSLLEKREGVVDNEIEHTTWVEYRLKGQPESAPIHRSVHVSLKQAVSSESAVGFFS